MAHRHFSITDKVIVVFDTALTTLWGQPNGSGRPSPAENIAEPELSTTERHKSIGLMRVNHAGEVSAQALYQGQALTAQLHSVKAAMQQAAVEENDHLLWCQQRLTQLEGRTSLLDPLWYTSSFILGALAGKAGDKWSLGFVAETEKQVAVHLDQHLQEVSEADLPSRAVLQQMKVDEIQHGQHAIAAGGQQLPAPIRGLMSAVSKLMTRSSYWL